MTARALIVDDEADLCRLIQITLTKMGIKSDVAYTLNTAYQCLTDNQYDFCLTDMNLPDGSGLDLVRHINRHHTIMPVAMITAHGNMDLAIEALKLGAFDFVNKPLELPRLKKLVEHALRVSQENIAGENDEIVPEKSPAQQLLDERLIGTSQVMQQLKATINKLSRSQAPVFLWGASGTGKEVVARLIHDLGHRREGSFVAVNCGAIPSELMESEFFGHKKGSFTGATTDKKGLFQQANGGTLFLDEVADLPLAMQVKLLRAIQEKSVRAIGDTKEVSVDIRILSATHKDLNKLVQDGAFRQDLFYRINVIELKLPTLNERAEDVPMLAEHFLRLIEEDWQLEENLMLSDDAKQALQNYDFEGNVRELRNVLERAITLSEGNIIDSQHLQLPQRTLTTEAIKPPVEQSITDHGKEQEDITPAVLEEKTTPPSEATNEQSQFSSSFNSVNPFKNQITAKLFNATFHGKVSTKEKQKPQPKIEVVDEEQSSLDSQLVTGLLSDLDPESGLPKDGLESFIQKQERIMLINALKHTNGNKTQTAKLLDMSLRSLRYRLDKLNIDTEE